MATKAATKRLTREYQNIQKNPPPYIVAHPSESNILEWHYILTGAPQTPYENGQYWGTLIFPPEYPFAPPAIRMHTPSGRFMPSTRLCLSISDFHPKSFNPAWEVSTILIGLLSFMNSEEMTTGSVSASDAERRLFAARSRWWNSTGGGSYTKAVPGVTSTIKGIANIKAGDGGKKFRAEWPELDQENWRWMQDSRVDPATGQILPDPNEALLAENSSSGNGSNNNNNSACSPETNALRRRPGGGSATGLGVVVEGGQRARDAGESWFRRNKVWICIGLVLGYALLSRLFDDLRAW
ncbi:ubiquitin-conjugating enzyme E2 [Trichophyton tonsurans CBS 112818]|uniref:Ubiquitin-conjugating enzyme E2 6 n=2 Tax=Trichophyton TaxID=5550 RepID=F2Q3H9_TRIEC|nr:ubiquitin-conjugating enzyme E2 [Trichophyton tonsurans CBS 112818]EGE08697.1 ubiquitin-conjugating enzyme E2 6 [Trichophyton equinum CBS 127.97]